MKVNVQKGDIRNISVGDIDDGDCFKLSHTYFMKVVVWGNDKENDNEELCIASKLKNDEDTILQLNDDGVIDPACDYFPCVNLETFHIWYIDSRSVCEPVASNLNIIEM